jgi:hypothetical protein
MDDQFTLDSMTKRITISLPDSNYKKLAMSCKRQWTTRSSWAKLVPIHQSLLRDAHEAVKSSLLLNSEIQIDGYIADASPAFHLMLY